MEKGSLFIEEVGNKKKKKKTGADLLGFRS